MTREMKFTDERGTGVLLHPTSLPGYADHGDIGHQAYRFIEFLNTNGYKVWQMLPLGPTHEDKSPYQCLSSHAGNPLLISLDWLVDRGWLTEDSLQSAMTNSNFRSICLQKACKKFYKLNDEDWLEKVSDFESEHSHWIKDYAMFVTIKEKNANKPWYEWPLEERHKDAAMMDSLSRELAVEIQQVIFEQFVFFTQWHEIREYARKHSIQLFGDMPIFVARDSADVWAHRENFLNDENGEMEFVAGVPPDAFSETGQRWGNPLFNWDYMQQTNFSWWKQRFATQLELFDMLRIDHFRGLESCWHIPADEETAINGEWVKVPGDELLTELFDEFEDMQLIAEDLGVITDEVIELKNNFNLPGMKVLQFAFDGNNRNPHLPHLHQQNDIVYTGTHDNDTSYGWIQTTGNYNDGYFGLYAHCDNCNDQEKVLSLIRMAMSSVSFLCVLPMQDILMLGTDARMNVPGTTEDNWRWRFNWDQVKPDVLNKITEFMYLYQR